MLYLTIPDQEFWDEKNEKFIQIKGQKLSLEHSLVSISKWEIKWQKPFISDKPKTNEEMIDYIKCMTITQNVDDSVYTRLTRNNLKEIENYISNPSTATWFNDVNVNKASSKKEQITNELVYYWMTALQIPFECDKWHFNRLMTLIRICNLKNQPSKKQGKRDTMKNNAALNAARRQKMGTHG